MKINAENAICISFSLNPPFRFSPADKRSELTLFGNSILPNLALNSEGANILMRF
jgi:hypothetical protein